MFFTLCYTCSCSVPLCRHTYKVVVSPDVTTQRWLTMVPADQKYPSPYTLTWNKLKQVYVWCNGIYLQRVDKIKKHIKYTSYKSSVSSVRVCSRSISDLCRHCDPTSYAYNTRTEYSTNINLDFFHISPAIQHPSKGKWLHRSIKHYSSKSLAIFTFVNLFFFEVWLLNNKAA